jgi:hypothetical protein
MWQRFGLLRVKRQKNSLNRQPIAYTARGGSVLTQHQSSDTEKDSQWKNTRDGSSGWLSPQLEISYFTCECSTPHFTITILGLGKTSNSQDRFSVIHTILSNNTATQYYPTIQNHSIIQQCRATVISNICTEPQYSPTRQKRSSIQQYGTTEPQYYPTIHKPQYFPTIQIRSTIQQQ